MNQIKNTLTRCCVSAERFELSTNGLKGRCSAVELRARHNSGLHSNMGNIHRQRGILGYREAGELDREPENTDVYVLRKKRMVSVSPLSLDLTSRVDFTELDRLMRS